MPVVNKVGDSFVKYLNRSETNKDDMEAKNLTQLCVAEILSRIGCGVKPNILEDRDPDKNGFYHSTPKNISEKSIDFDLKGAIHLKSSVRGF